MSRSTAWLYVVVAISGAAVLALEILGTRILGPFYGVSLFLWSSLITVTLAALSVGYALGGRWADRGPRPSRLASLLVGAGLWLLVIPWARRPVLLLVEPLGLRTAVLAAAFVLFFPPLTLLGMVSPYAVRLKVARLDEVGRTAGDLFAISTIASVAAALATGFWLIPNVGVTGLTRLVGAVLLVGALIALAADSASRSKAALLVAITLGLGAFAFAHETDRFKTVIGAVARDDEEGGRAGKGAAAADVVALRESPYAEVRVLDTAVERFLVIDGGAHTVVSREDGESLFPYVQVLDIVRYFFDEPGRLLLIGLGGGSIAKSYSAAGWSVDAVEIDPAIRDVAVAFFGLAPGDATTFCEDGRAFLRRGGGRYDAIVIDAFGSAAIPFHLVTREMFGLARGRLREGGILAMNIEGQEWHDPLVHSLAATLRQEFREVAALPISEPPNTLGNIVLLAADRPLQFPEERLGRPYDYLADPLRHWQVVQRNHAWNNRFEPDARGGQVLTDDKNPVDLWAERINRQARRRLHDDPNLAGVAW